MPEVVLEGCTPEPVMSYLKALGVLRLVSEQADGEARGCWRNDVFVLSSTLDRDSLLEFFLERYQPTPILAPWNGGSGFFPKDNHDAINALAADTVSPRCHPYREAIHCVRKILREEKITTKPNAQKKEELLRRCRRELPIEIVEWMDAAMVLREDGQTFAPLLGTGGNDGRLDFTQNFMGRLVLLGVHQEQPTPQSRPWLEHALCARPLSGLPTAAVGQFAPGRAGGPNATQGMEGSPIDNPWEFVLMIEGTLCLAGAAVRRFTVSSESRAALPFTVMPSPAGSASGAEADAQLSRGELWLPVWKRPAQLAELRALFGEGRATVGRRMARSGVEFARAVACLGVDRGVREFVRLGFLRRSGKAYLATPLGRIEVPAQPRSEVALLQEVDPWLDGLRNACGSNGPARFLRALRAVDRAVFDVCRYKGSRFFQAVVRALGRAERELALSAGKVGDRVVRPLAGLSQKWLAESNDGSLEFEIALALAGIYGQAGKIGPLRVHLEPVDWRRACRAWAEKDRSVVWTPADLATNLCAVLTRRLMDAHKAGCGTLPLASTSPASLAAISAFLAGDTDDRKIHDLLWALNLVQPGRVPRSTVPQSPPLPRTYALLKLLFLPKPLRISDLEYTVRPEPRILPLLRADRVGDACQIALRRLRGSGLTPMPYSRSGSAAGQRDWDDTSFPNVAGPRLAAALLIPISDRDARALAQFVLRPSTLDQQTLPVSKETQSHDY